MDQQAYYRISSTYDRVHFQEISRSEVYSNISSGFTRKAYKRSDKYPFSGEQFIDHDFDLPERYNIKYVRLYDFYEEDEDLSLFPPDETRSSFIKQMDQYPSFLGQSGIISYKYLRTLFFTQDISANGYYRYFIKRNGQYYIEECDDMIPVDSRTNKPLYGLSPKHPWQIILMKAWLKQTGGWQEFQRAEPFRFLDAFGLPQYKTFNFKKELDFLKNQRVSAKKREQNVENFAMNKQNVIILAQTKNDEKLKKIGLIPNAAAYKIIKITEQGCYRIHSSLPCKWVGKLSPVEQSKLNNMNIRNHQVNLQRTFLITEEQALNYFGKCYVIPEEITEIQNFKTQDCMRLNVQANKQVWININSKDKSDGLLAISIEMKHISNLNHVYPEMKYFLSKKNNQQEMRQSHIRNDIRQSKMKQNQYIQSNCDKWSLYRIDYHRGYHHSAAFYTKIIEGQYILYIQFDQDVQINIRFDSQVKIERPEQITVSNEQSKTIFDSTFFQVAQNMGIETSFNKKAYDESILISNSFDEVGFGSIAIATLSKARHQVGMRVYPHLLKKAGYDFCGNFYSVNKKEGQENEDQKAYVLVSKKGKPEIIVLQRVDKSIKTTIDEDFPPKGSVQFFKITPLDELRKSKQRSQVKGSSVRKSSRQRSRINKSRQRRSRID